jgi:hypothetical protein
MSILVVQIQPAVECFFELDDDSQLISPLFWDAVAASLNGTVDDYLGGCIVVRGPQLKA